MDFDFMVLTTAIEFLPKKKNNVDSSRQKWEEK